jgi:hypothetical protein
LVLEMSMLIEHFRCHGSPYSRAAKGGVMAGDARKGKIIPGSSRVLSIHRKTGLNRHKPGCIAGDNRLLEGA